jgi:hypothetical protein
LKVWKLTEHKGWPRNHVKPSMTTYKVCITNIIMMHIIFGTHTKQRYKQINSQMLVFLPNEAHGKSTTSYLNPKNN